MITNIDTFLHTLIDVTNRIDYAEQSRNQQERYNALFGFVPVLRNSVSMARRITEESIVNGFNAQIGDYHVRPMSATSADTDGWVVAGDIFGTTYEWVAESAPIALGFEACRKKVPTWVYPTNRMEPWTHTAVIHTLEGEQVVKWGDWIAMGVRGEMWPIPAENHSAYKFLDSALETR